MAQIPGLPIDEPVARPKASPGEFASPGATVAELGQETENLALANQAFEGYLIAAQRQLRAKEAEVSFQRVLSQVHADLDKASTPEEVDAIQAHARGDLHSSIEPYKQHDHVLGQHLDIYAQQQDVELQNTVNAKKAEIISKADAAMNTVKKQTTLDTSINIRAAGGDWTVPRAQYELWLHSSASTKTMPPEVIEKLLQQWDTEHEAGYIDAQLGSENLQTVQNMVNELRLHPEKYPHLNKADINQYINKGNNAIVSRMSLQDEINAKTEEGRYWNQSPDGVPRKFTDRDGNFDTQGALKYIGSRGLSPEGLKKLIGDVKAQGVASGAQLEQQVSKIQTGIVDAGNKHNHKQEASGLEQLHQFTILHPEYADVFKGMSNYIDEKHSRAMSLQIESFRVHQEAYQLQKIQEQDQSWGTYGQLGPGIAAGKYTDTQLRLMTGGGTGKLQPGQMLPQQVDQAIKLNHASETDPHNRPYINSIWNDPALSVISQGRIVNEFYRWLDDHPQATDDQKQKAVNQLVEPDHIQLINNRIDALGDVLNGNPNAKPPQGPSWWQRLTTNPEGGPITQPTGSGRSRSFDTPLGTTGRARSTEDGKMHFTNEDGDDLGVAEQ